MILSLIVFLLILGVLVFVHELGHFAVAKWCGMRVDEFAIGFPPRAKAWKRGETTYALNTIPFGGYVKIHGEAFCGEVDEDPRSFERKPVWARILVIIAGVTMNVLFAFVILTVAFSVGFTSYSQDLSSMPGATVTQSKLVISQVVENSPAAKAAVEPGDYLISIGKDGTFTQVEDLGKTVAEYTREQRDAGVKAVTLRVERAGEQRDLEVTMATEGYPLGIASQPINTVRVPFYRAPEVAIREMGFIFSLTWESLQNFGHKLFYRAELDEQVSGPIGIYQATDSATRMGFNSTLFLMVALSLNLALLNILPIPALDGGKLLFLIIEGIFGKRAVNRKWESAISFAGFTLLILLIVILSIRDIVRLF